MVVGRTMTQHNVLTDSPVSQGELVVGRTNWGGGGGGGGSDVKTVYPPTNTVCGGGGGS